MGRMFLYSFTGHRTRVMNSLKLQERRFRLRIRKTFQTMSLVKQWNRLPREVMELLVLEVLSAKQTNIYVGLFTQGRICSELRGWTESPLQP